MSSIKGTATVELTDLVALLTSPETKAKERRIRARVRVDGRLLDDRVALALAPGHTVVVDLSSLLQSGLLSHGRVQFLIELTPET